MSSVKRYEVFLEGTVAGGAIGYEEHANGEWCLYEDAGAFIQEMGKQLSATQAENKKLQAKFKRCDEERAMACRQVEKHKGMWKGQCNRTALLETENATYRKALEDIVGRGTDYDSTMNELVYIAREALERSERATALEQIKEVEG